MLALKSSMGEGVLYHAGKRSREGAASGKQCCQCPADCVPSQGCAHCSQRCLLALQSPPEPSVPCTDQKSQTKNKRASGEKINKNVKDKTPPAQKKDSASKLDKKDIKVNMICPG